MSKLFVASEVFHGAWNLSELKNISGKKAIIVTGGQSMKKSGTLDRAKEFLTEAGLETIVFDGVEEDPSSATSLKGAEIMRAFQPDWIVGLGGCSAIDAAKMMWVFYEHPNADFEAMTKPFSVPTLRQKAKFVAIPSTSGTGTETTGLAVITDKEKGVKYPIVSYELTPDIAIVDGEICATMPAHMHDASFMGGLAFNKAWLGIVHSLSHQVGALYGIPHGAANAIFLPNVIRYNQTETTRYPNLAKIVGKETAEELAQEIEKLRASVNNFGSLKAFGISREDWDKNLDYITKNALEDPCTGFNPRKPSLQDLKDLYNACYEGVIY